MRKKSSVILGIKVGSFGDANFRGYIYVPKIAEKERLGPGYATKQKDSDLKGIIFATQKYNRPKECYEEVLHYLKKADSNSLVSNKTLVKIPRPFIEDLRISIYERVRLLEQGEQNIQVDYSIKYFTNEEYRSKHERREKAREFLSESPSDNLQGSFLNIIGFIETSVLQEGVGIKYAHMRKCKPTKLEETLFQS